MAEHETKDAGADRKAVHRSPKYPGLTLEDAIGRVRTVYDHEKKTPASAKVIAEDLGLTPGTGPANRVISAMRQYGLLEVAGKQKLRISEAGSQILHLSEGSPDRQAALRHAVRKPLIVQDLLKEFPDGFPSDTNLKDFLLNKKGFNPEAVDFFVRTLRKNLAFVPSDGINPEETEDPQVESEPEIRGGGFFPPPPKPPAAPPTATGERERLRFSLSGDRTVRLIFGGPQPTQAEIDELMDYLKISRRTFPSAEATTTGDEERDPVKA